MSEKSNFALVPRPPGALEKAEPGAKQILSGMVADTLALAKKEQATKSVVSVAMCGWAEPGLQQMVETMLRQGLATQSRIEFKFFFWTTDFIEAARHSRFDLFILWLNPGSYSRKDTAERPLGLEANWDDHGDEVNAYELIAGLKREFNRPVIAISNCSTYESKTELERAGADAVFWMPFGIDEFLSALQRCLKIPLPVLVKEEPPANASSPIEGAARSTEPRPLRIIMVDDVDTTLDAIRNMMQFLLPEATILAFQWAGDGLKEVEREAPDLFTTDWTHAGMPGPKILERLAAMKIKCPIFVISAAIEAIKATTSLREYKDQGFNITFLPKPFTLEQLRPLLSKHLGPGDGPKRRNGAP
jgi:CheY-like chemotaxis protein